MSIKVKVNIKNINPKIQRAIKASQSGLAMQVAKDSNKFVPYKYGALAASVWSSSQFEKGLIIWGVKYAARLYWNPQYNFNRTHNALAQGKWFEAAKSEYSQSWSKFAENEIKRHL